MSAPIDLHALVREHGGQVSRDGRSAFLPDIGHSRRDRGLKVLITDDGRPVVHSFHGGDWRAIKSHLGLDEAQPERLSPSELRKRQESRQRAQAERRAAVRAFCASTWNGTEDATGSPVQIYLRTRGLDMPCAAVLRFHAACPRAYPSADKPTWVAPAMVAVVHGQDGTPCGLHVTAIKPDGSGKAFGDRARLMFGDVTGGAVRLSDAGKLLAVAEGIETALSFALLRGVPTWACLSTSGMKAFRPPDTVRKLLIAADGDDAGERAAMQLAETASRRCEVEIHTPDAGMDWNDVLREPPR